MIALKQALSGYLELRRNLGFKLERDEMRLRCFLAFLESEKNSRITSQLALRFATRLESRSPLTVAGDLRAIRGFARYMIGVDPATEVPASGLLGRCRSRFKPHIYSAEEIRQLLEAARNHPSSEKFALKPASLYCLLGLLAATGMRLSEALSLRPEDIDWSESLLRIQKAKFLKSRLVPLQRSTLSQLRIYAKRRDEFFAERPLPPGARFFVTSRGSPYSYTYVNMQFRDLSRSIGLRVPGQRRGPRIHDLRHRFAITTLLRWYRSGKQIDQFLPVLSTYLGYRNVTGTYRYLSCTSELMKGAGKRLEARWQEGRS